MAAARRHAAGSGARSGRVAEAAEPRSMLWSGALAVPPTASRLTARPARGRAGSAENGRGGLLQDPADDERADDHQRGGGQGVGALLDPRRGQAGGAESGGQGQAGYRDDGRGGEGGQDAESRGDAEG